MSSVEMILEHKARRVIRVGEEDSVLEAATRMNENRIGAVVVTRGDKVVGIFTERDVLCRVVAARRDPAATRVADVMTTPVAVCYPDTSADECRAVMRARRLRHLPVVKDDRLVGIVSIGDLNEAEQARQQATIRYLHEYVYGEWK